MARLPTRDDLGPLPAVRPTQPPRGVARADASALGTAMEGFGKSLGKVGAELYAQQQAAEEFETERKFQEFKWEEAKQLEEGMRSVEPGQAEGFADRWADGYKDRAKGFLSTVPQSLKGKYDNKLFDVERQNYGASAQFARHEQKRYSIQSLDDHKNRLAIVGDIDSARADYTTLLQKNPYLTPIEKDKVGRSHLDDLERQHVDWRIKTGKGLDTVLEDLHAGSTKSTGSTSEEGLEFIRKKEGFAPTAKWDRKQYSVGYGSKAEAGGTMTKEQADAALRKETAILDGWISENISHQRELTQKQHDALVSFGRNLGVGALDELRDDIINGDFSKVAARMRTFNKARDEKGELREEAGLTTRRSEEAAMLEGQEGKYRHLSAKNRAALIHNAQIAQRADTLQSLQDDAESIRRTGVPVSGGDAYKPGSLQRSVRVLTPNQQRKAEIALKEAHLEYQATVPLSEMSEREAVDHIVKFAPEGKESGDSYKTAARVQAKAERAWRRISEERTKDPARAVSGMRVAGTVGNTLRMGPDGELQVQEGEPDLAMGPAREVRSAMDQIKKRTPTAELVQSEDGEVTLQETPGKGPPPQAAWRLLIEGRLAAQTRLGIPAHSQRVLTRGEAARLLDMPAEGQLSDDEFSRRLRIAADRADQTFGSYGPQALKSALSFYIKNKEHQEEMTGVITRLARGQRRESIRPSEIESMRRLDELNRIDEMFKGEGVRKAEKSYPKPEDHHLDWAMAKPGREKEYDQRYGPGAFARESAKRVGSP